MFFEQHRLIDILSEDDRRCRKKYLVKLNNAEYEQLQQCPELTNIRIRTGQAQRLICFMKVEN
jgi:aspartyl/asparaginyl beta-hydroxylase (cupin superfamily)